MIEAIMNYFANLFAPKFKVGDRIYYSDTDFPDYTYIKEITGIGNSEYQYKIIYDNNYDSKSRHTSSISYVDSHYSIVKEEK